MHVKTVSERSVESDKFLIPGNLVLPPHRLKNIDTFFKTTKFHDLADRSNVAVEVTSLAKPNKK